MWGKERRCHIVQSSSRKKIEPFFKVITLLTQVEKRTPSPQKKPPNCPVTIGCPHKCKVKPLHAWERHGQGTNTKFPTRWWWQLGLKKIRGNDFAAAILSSVLAQTHNSEDEWIINRAHRFLKSISASWTLSAVFREVFKNYLMRLTYRIHIYTHTHSLVRNTNSFCL